MKYKEIEQLTKEQKIEYLGKYLSRYIDEVITRFTNNKEYTNQVISDNTVMYMVKYVIDSEQANVNNIINKLSAPFENNYYNYSYKNEYNHILYELIIKD